MNASRELSVAVIIAVRNAGQTIAEAIGSALAQDATAEVIVVDDASSDDTAEVSRAADDGSGRLRIVRMAECVGPSRARNEAIALSTAPLIAILDGDDIFLPGRFDRLLSRSGWDVIADNIAMVPDEEAVWLQRPWERLSCRAETLDLSLTAFLRGNLAGRGRRRELGFLKPVMRRSWLQEARLRYNEAIRFAEDYDLYCRALIGGARFKVDLTVGYAARVRTTSLSALHSATDLAALVGLDDVLLSMEGVGPQARVLLETHRSQVRLNHAYRKLLDHRRASGRLAALAGMAASPRDAPAHLRRLIGDKWVAAGHGPSAEPRLLIASPDELRG
jgi:succinoglycan biosynthesis protein ExoU